MKKLQPRERRMAIVTGVIVVAGLLWSQAIEPTYVTWSQQAEHLSKLEQLVSRDREAGERLGRWIAEVGERPILLSGDEKYYIDDGGDDAIDLVVSDLDTDDPAGRALLDRLLPGPAFEHVPQLHLFRPPSLRAPPRR